MAKPIVPVESAHGRQSTGVLLFSLVFFWVRSGSSKSTIYRPKWIEISLCQFSCTELQPVGLLLSMTLVHLLVRARWLGQLVALGWGRNRRVRNTFVLSECNLITAAITLAVRTHVHHVRCHPRTLPASCQGQAIIFACCDMSLVH